MCCGWPTRAWCWASASREWVGHAPALEEDLGLANLSLDLIGQARLLLTYAGEIEGRGRIEDDLAYPARSARSSVNSRSSSSRTAISRHTIVRQLLIDAYQLELYERLQQSTDARLAEIAAKALKETRYHFRYSAGWVVRLGDGTEESHRACQSALDALWRFTRELFAADEIDAAMAARGVAPELADLGRRLVARVDEVLTEATLQAPGGRALLVARQAWPAQRASGLSARGDAGPCIARIRGRTW